MNSHYFYCVFRTDYHNPPGLWKAEHVAGWKKVTDAVHANGSYIYAQLWHRKSDLSCPLVCVVYTYYHTYSVGRLAYPEDGNPVCCLYSISSVPSADTP